MPHKMLISFHLIRNVVSFMNNIQGYVIICLVDFTHSSQVIVEEQDIKDCSYVKIF